MKHGSRVNATKLALVTGGAGFIGSHLVEHLLTQGWKVRVLDELSTGHRSNLSAVEGKIEFIEGSITDGVTVERAAEGVEAVFHLAAKVFVPESFGKPEEYERVNVVGTAQILAAARNSGVRRVVFSSTCAVYGNTTALPITETAPSNPLSPYAQTKLAGEKLGREQAGTGGPGFSALRYFNVYGPRQDPRSAYSGVISRFADALAQGIPPTIYGDGKQTRDFIYMRDVARANLLAATQPDEPFAIYNVGTGKETTINELVECMAGFQKASQASEPVRPNDARANAAESGGGGSFQPTAPSAIGRPPISTVHYLPARTGDILRSVADVSLAAIKLGFAAQTTVNNGVAHLLSS